MEGIEWKKQKHHLLKGETIELVPVTKKDINFICREETDAKLWQYEEYVETNKQCILKKFTDRIEQDNVFDFIVKRISDDEPVGVVFSIVRVGKLDMLYYLNIKVTDIV